MLNQQRVELHIMLVIVSKDASFKLDNSMFVVNGSYESGYVHNKDIFMIEGITSKDYCKVSEVCLLQEKEFDFIEVELNHAGIVSHKGTQWDMVQQYTYNGFTVTVYSLGVDQLFEIYYGTEYLGNVSNDCLGDGYIMTTTQALNQVLKD